MNYDKLNELYKKTEILLDNCTEFIDNESDYYISISNHLKNIMKEINSARIKSIPTMKQQTHDRARENSNNRQGLL